MSPASSSPDVVLVGGGIMSATLATLLQHVQPDWSVVCFEAAEGVGEESSGPWNNAGTGHSALCELNYTPAARDGSVDVTKAVGIAEQFHVSRQFWSSLVRAGLTSSPRDFITSVPHVSFVTGDDGQAYMKARYAAMSAQPLFAELEHTDDPAALADWTPLMMDGRDPAQPVAATRSVAGTDVNFGALTSLLFDAAVARGAVLQTGTRVLSIRRSGGGGPGGRGWRVTVRRDGQRPQVLDARFVFVGAGGGALRLLQQAGIPEVRGFGGFPVSGQFFRTRRRELVERHQAKVCSQAKVGAPPMSVPHLDLRLIDGEHSLLFGPYAGFSPKFLKTGSLLDLPRSVTLNNLESNLGVAATNAGLLKYLVGQILQSRAARVTALGEFVPTVDGDDWELITAGQRVQVISRSSSGRGGTLQFGTEIISSADGSIAGLLGASPGASTSVSAMLTVLERCFPDRTSAWRPKVEELVPTYGTKLSADPALTARVKEETAQVLQLTA